MLHIFLILILNCLLLLLFQKTSEIMTLISFLHIFLLKQLHNFITFIFCILLIFHSIHYNTFYFLLTYFVFDIFEYSLCTLLHFHTFAIVFLIQLANQSTYRDVFRLQEIICIYVFNKKGKIIDGVFSKSQDFGSASFNKYINNFWIYEILYSK